MTTDSPSGTTARIDPEHLLRVLSPHVESGLVPGAVLALDHGGDTVIRAIGRAAVDGAERMADDALFRISSMTKPLAAVLTLMLAEDGALALDDPVHRWLPELAGQRVLRRIDGPATDTEPVARPVTVADLLTMRMGFGHVFDRECPVLGLAAAAGLGIGPPDPSVPLTPDEWITRFAALPLLHQPGADWMYDLAYGVLGVLLARAAGMPLGELFQGRLFGPLGMTDSGFAVPAHARDRLVPSYVQTGPGALAGFDGVRDSRWLAAPAFPDARGGLVCTAADYLRFTRLLLAGGVAADGTRLLGETSVTAMTTDQLGTEREDSASTGIFLSGGGWGYGVEVIGPDHADGDHTGGGDPAGKPGMDGPLAWTHRYGWGGGLGTGWFSYPEHDLSVLLLTQCMPPPAPMFADLWSALHRMLADPDHP